MAKSGTHAVVGVWNMAEGMAVEQAAGLEREVLPRVRQQPGFVAGYWLQDRATRKSYSFIVLENEAAARQFKAVVESNPLGRERSGVSKESLEILEVVAEVLD